MFTAEKQLTAISQVKFVSIKIEVVKLKLSENDPRKREKYYSKWEPFFGNIVK